MYRVLNTQGFARISSSHRIVCYTTASKPEKKVKYTDTVILPQTKFPQFLNSVQVVKRDNNIQKECGFLDLYEWQQTHLKGKEFILHDGPPYANGKPHIGHAINKILKDITLRSHLIRGRKVHYIPGWDCHGLPIELKALQNSNQQLSATEVRRKAQQFAESSAKVQMDSFKSWGVLGNWAKGVYYTYDINYICNQLQNFYKLFEKGYLFRDLKPVYWSPSSRSALAESELIYKDHISRSVTIGLELVDHNLSQQSVHVLVWTTTPWTLPLNEAVCYSNQLSYSLVSIGSTSELYILATELVPALQQKIKCDFNVHSSFPGQRLEGLKYKHPWKTEELKPLLHGNHVTASGTGMVHSAPAHGQDDFLIGLAHNLPLESCVNELGRYTSKLGSELDGLDVLKDANAFIIEKLKPKILLEENYQHSYPYDWRTDKPVIIRASEQWFIDTSRLKEKALECLKSVSCDSQRLESLVQARPYWCISRQRYWGVPIPVFYHKVSGRPLISKKLVHHLCDLFEKKGADSWWTEPLEVLFPPSVQQHLFVNIDNVIRGADIMDIWLDSGLSWSSVLDGRVADLCIEGEDQFTGWFQSSLLTSVALQEKPPFKKLLTHGFAVDEDGRKMSKSVGNVVDPDIVVTGKAALGVDTLRWFVASHFHHPQVPVSDRLLKVSSETVQKIRLVLRFLLGSLKNISEEELSTEPLLYLDRYMLDQCWQLYGSIMPCYDNYKFNQVCKLLNHFISTDVSSLYVHVIKDRLYCDPVDSERRVSCRVTLYYLLETILHCVGPVLPHLAEEVYLYHPLYGGKRKLYYNVEQWQPLSSWKDSDAQLVVSSALKLKEEIDTKSGAGSVQHMSAEVTIGEEQSIIMKLQPEHVSLDSELCELLQVASVSIHKSTGHQFNVTLKDSPYSKCPRCRRFTSLVPESLCERCVTVLARLPSRQ